MIAKVGKSFGFGLAFIALTAFLLHPNHLSLEAGSENSTHCCVCHTVPMGVSLLRADPAPAAFVAYDITPASPARIARLQFSLETPRGPPAA